jgi:hypothetical protein
MRLRRQPHCNTRGESHFSTFDPARKASVESGEGHHDRVGMPMGSRLLSGLISVLEHAHIIVLPKNAVELRVRRCRIGIGHLRTLLRAAARLSAVAPGCRDAVMAANLQLRPSNSAPVRGSTALAPIAKWNTGDPRSDTGWGRTTYLSRAIWRGASPRSPDTVSNMDVVTATDLRCRDMPRLMTDVDPDHYDMVFLSVGVQDALDFAAPEDVPNAVERILRMLTRAPRRPLPVFLIGVPPVSRVLRG